jgi:UDP-N-acetylmuramoyl-tripeptide--D-alanyl-D-alanine ligase
MLIDEAYNGQPPSMRAALALLAQLPAQRRLAVLGQMGELGDFAAEEHRALAGPAQQAADLVFTCGPLMRHLAEALPAPKAAAHAETAVELAPLVLRALRPGDAVLVKGSKATGMKAVVEALKGPGARSGGRLT